MHMYISLEVFAVLPVQVALLKLAFRQRRVRMSGRSKLYSNLRDIPALLSKSLAPEDVY